MKQLDDSLPGGDFNCLTCIGVGPTGVAVADHLYRKGVRDLTLVAVDIDGPTLRASVVNNKMAFTADVSEQPINGGNTITMAGAGFRLCVLTVVLVGSNDPKSRRLAPIIVAELNRVGQVCVVAVVQQTDDVLPAMATFLPELQRFSKNMIVIDPRFQHLQNPWYHAGEVIEILAGVCGIARSNVDYKDLYALIKDAGRIAVGRGSGRGAHRIMEAYAELSGMINAQYVDFGRTTRIVLVLTCSTENAITMGEQRTLIRKITSSLYAEATLFKFGYLIDEKAGDSVVLDLLVWMPVDQPA